MLGNGDCFVDYCRYDLAADAQVAKIIACSAAATKNSRMISISWVWESSLAILLVYPPLEYSPDIFVE
jgi:hypothetical protein